MAITVQNFDFRGINIPQAYVGIVAGGVTVTGLNKALVNVCIWDSAESRKKGLSWIDNFDVELQFSDAEIQTIPLPGLIFKKLKEKYFPTGKDFLNFIEEEEETTDKKPKKK